MSNIVQLAGANIDNATMFVSVINSDVGHVCPYCPHRETVFHCFIESCQLLPLFAMLEHIFGPFGECKDGHISERKKQNRDCCG